MTQTPLELFSVDRLINDEDRDIRDTVRRFVEKEIKPHIAGWYEAGRIPAKELARARGRLD